MLLTHMSSVKKVIDNSQMLVTILCAMSTKTAFRHLYCIDETPV